MNSSERSFNIVFYCSSLSWGGLEMNVIRFASWMQERGHKITVCCVKGSPLMDSAQKQNLTTQTVTRNKKYFDLISAFKFARLTNQLGADVVWYRDNRDLSTLGWAKLFGGKFKLLYQQAMQLGVDKKDFIHTWRFKQIDAWIAPLIFLANQV